MTPRHDDLDGQTNKQLAGPCYPNQPTSSLHSFLQQTAPRISRVKRDAPAMTCLWRAGSGIGDISAGSLSILPSTMVLSSSERRNVDNLQHPGLGQRGLTAVGFVPKRTVPGTQMGCRQPVHEERGCPDPGPRHSQQCEDASLPPRTLPCQSSHAANRNAAPPG